jgi:histidinol-phosphate aminotransferase
MGYFRNNIEAMEGYVPGEQPDDPSVIKLNTNENPYPPSPRVMEAIAAIKAEQLRRYPDPMGNRFRDTAAQIFGVSRDHVICGNGMDDILNMSVRAFSGPEAALVYPTPTYTLYAVLAQIQASIVKEVPFGADFTLPTCVGEGGGGSPIWPINAPDGTFVPVQEIARLTESLEDTVRG